MNCLLTIVTLMIAVLVSGSQDECDHEVVSRIVQQWEGSPPSNVLAQMEGVFTYVWLSKKFMPGILDKVRCVATILDPDHTTTTSVFLYKDTNDIHLHTYKKIENGGKITLTSPNLPDESQYVVSYEDGVLAFYQCMHTDASGRYKPFAGVAVSEKNLASPSLDQQVELAKQRLTALGLGDGTTLEPCDPDVIAIV